MIPWTLRRKTPPTERVVSTQELLEHDRLGDDTSEEDLLAAMGIAAEQAVEEELSRSILTQTWELRLDAFPCEEIGLPRGPVASLAAVTPVQYVDTNGTTQTLSSSLYTVDLYSTPPRILRAYSATWPVTRVFPNAVLVTYVTGEALELVPEMIRLAVKMTALDLFQNRERSGAVGAVKELDFYERLIGNYRNLWDPCYR